MKVYNKLDALIGNTPILEVANIKKSQKLCARLLVKLEGFNPAGSVKDRVALFMINDAENRGLITAGATIIEATSGNTGIGLASICASRGYKAVITMPNSMSAERVKLLKAYGAQVELTDGKKGMQGAIDLAKEINQKTPNSLVVGQFSNPANVMAHYQTTGPEIWKDTDGNIDFFVAGIGSGGTISGVGKYLKEQNNKVQIIGVEPSDSPLITKGISGAHKVQGIGANFIPSIYDATVVDKVLTATYDDAKSSTNLLAKEEGLLVGISSGASLSVGLSLAKDKANAGKTIVVILADSGDKYLSTDLFE